MSTSISNTMEARAKIKSASINTLIATVNFAESGTLELLAECNLSPIKANKIHGRADIMNISYKKGRVYSDNDTYINNENPVYNYADASALKYGKHPRDDDEYRMFISFDELLNIPNDIATRIVISRLHFTAINAFSGTIKLYELPYPFNEKALTWENNSYNESEMTLLKEITIDKATYDITINLGLYAREVASHKKIHNGFYIKAEPFFNVFSSNFTSEPEWQPYIEYEYFDPATFVSKQTLLAESRYAECKYLNAECNLDPAYPVLEAEAKFSKDNLYAEVDYNMHIDLFGELRYAISGIPIVLDAELLFSKENIMAETIVGYTSQLEAEVNYKKYFDSDPLEAESKFLYVKYLLGEAISGTKTEINSEMKLGYTSDVSAEVLYSQEFIYGECDYYPISVLYSECNVSFTSEPLLAECNVNFTNIIDSECNVNFSTEIEAEVNYHAKDTIKLDAEAIRGYVSELPSEMLLIFEYTSEPLESIMKLGYKTELLSECDFYPIIKIPSECNIAFSSSIDAEANVIFSNEIEAEAKYCIESDPLDSECNVNFSTSINAEANILFNEELPSECNINFSTELPVETRYALLSEPLLAECNNVFITVIDSECSVNFSTEIEAEANYSIESEPLEAETEFLYVEYLLAECNPVFNNRIVLDAEVRFIKDESIQIDSEVNVNFSDSIDAETNIIFSSIIDSEVNVNFKSELMAECNIIFESNSLPAEIDIIFESNKLLGETKYAITSIIDSEVNINFKSELMAECTLSKVGEMELPAECNVIFNDSIDAEAKYSITSIIDSECSINFKSELMAECTLSKVGEMELPAELKYKITNNVSILAEAAIFDKMKVYTYSISEFEF